MEYVQTQGVPVSADDWAAWPSSRNMADEPPPRNMTLPPWLFTPSRTAGLATPLKVAVVFVAPARAVVASPDELNVATVVSEEAHAAEFVRSRVLPSLYCPVAVNCWVSPANTMGLFGVTVIDTGVGGAFTTCVNAPLLPPKFASPPYCADIEWEPTASADVGNCACPFAPNATCPSCVVPSRNVTVPVGVPVVCEVTVAVKAKDCEK